MATFRIASYSPEYFEGVKRCAWKAFPDIRHGTKQKSPSGKVRCAPELFLVALDGDVAIGSIMAGYDGHRGWLMHWPF